MASAVSKALATNELLENILVHLELDDLLRVKRVCKQWNETILGSPSIQMILYLRPCPSHLPQQINPLFSKYIMIDSKRAGLMMFPATMKMLLNRVPLAWRSMLMFQPPQQYSLTLRTIPTLGFTVQFPNESDVPVMSAIEKAESIVAYEKKRRENAKNNLQLRLHEALTTRRGNIALVNSNGDLQSVG